MTWKSGGLSPTNRPRLTFKRLPRTLKHGIPNVMLSDHTRIKRDVPDFQEGVRYTNRELLLLAEKMLIEDPKPVDEEPCILLIPHLKERQKREIYNANGVPDPSIQSGLYWRTHPQGRKWLSKENRQNKRSFYQ